MLLLASGNADNQTRFVTNSASPPLLFLRFPHPLRDCRQRHLPCLHFPWLSSAARTLFFFSHLFWSDSLSVRICVCLCVWVCMRLCVCLCVCYWVPTLMAGTSSSWPAFPCRLGFQRRLEVLRSKFSDDSTGFLCWCSQDGVQDWRNVFRVWGIWQVFDTRSNGFD